MTTHTTTILERLRSETRPQHDRLEEVAASDKLAAGTLHVAEYVALLKANYVAHRWLEQKIMALPEMQLLLEERQKLSLLAQDLQQAGQDPEQVWLALQEKLSLEGPKNKYEALGMQYVMEGATLGGVVILKALNQHPQLQEYQPFNYYACYGSDTGRRWSGFKQLMQQQLQTPEQEEQVLQGCKAAYRLFEKAFLAVQKSK